MGLLWESHTGLTLPVMQTKDMRKRSTARRGATIVGKRKPSSTKGGGKSNLIYTAEKNIHKSGEGPTNPFRSREGKS